MYLLGNILVSLARVISMITTIYSYIIIGTVLISWVSPDPYNPIVRFLRQVTEPLFYRVRKILPRFFFASGLDFTPMIVLILLHVLSNLITNFLFRYGAGLIAK